MPEDVTFRMVTLALYRRIQSDPAVRHHEIEAAYRLALEDALRQLFVIDPRTVTDCLNEQHAEPKPTDPAPTAVLDLMDALRESVKAAKERRKQ